MIYVPNYETLHKLYVYCVSLLPIVKGKKAILSVFFDDFPLKLECQTRRDMIWWILNKKGYNMSRLDQSYLSPSFSTHQITHLLDKHLIGWKWALTFSKFALIMELFWMINFIFNRHWQIHRKLKGLRVAFI